MVFSIGKGRDEGGQSPTEIKWQTCLLLVNRGKKTFKMKTLDLPSLNFAHVHTWMVGMGKLLQSVQQRAGCRKSQLRRSWHHLCLWKLMLSWLFCFLYCHATSLKIRQDYENRCEVRVYEKFWILWKSLLFSPQEPNTWNTSYQNGKLSKNFPVTNHYPLTTITHQDSFKIFFFFLSTFLTLVGEQASLLQS